MSNTVITIARQFGSGGRELGRRLAEELGIEYYDKEILVEIAKHTDLSEEYVHQIVDRKPHQLYPITIGQTITYSDQYAFKQVMAVYQAQSEIIHSLADKSSCVIVGRCADYILRNKDPYRIFVYADFEHRLKRCRERQESGENLTDRQLKKQIHTIDKGRSKYYEYYTGLRWDDIYHYDLCINTSGIEIKSMIPHLAGMFRANG